MIQDTIIGYCMLHDRGYTVLKEGLIKTYPIEMALWHIKECFKLSDNKEVGDRIEEGENIELSDCNGIINIEEGRNGSRFIRLLLPRDFSGYGAIEQHLRTYGYFLSVEEYIGSLWHYYKFEKKFDNEVTNEVMRNNYLYHICSESALNKIMKIGLIPKESQWNGFKNEARIYLFSKELSDGEFNFWAENFRTNKGKLSENYYLLEIDVNKINNNPTFFTDTRMENAVYTMTNINPEAITIIKKYNEDED